MSSNILDNSQEKLDNGDSFRGPDEEEFWAASNRRPDALTHISLHPTSTEPSAEQLSVGKNDVQRESDEATSVADATYNRMAKAPVLPSASSAADIKLLTEKIARARVQRNASPANSRRTSKSRTRQGNIRGHHVLSMSPLWPRRDPTSPPPSDIFDRSHTSRKRQNENFDEQPNYQEVEDYSGSHSSCDYEGTEFRRITAYWTKLSANRNAIKTTIQNIEKTRAHLAKLRQRKNNSTLAFMAQIQKLLPHHPELDKHYKQTEELNSSNLDAENGLEELIDQLQEEEIQIEIQERQFFTTFMQSDISSEPEDHEPVTHKPSRISLRGIDGDRPADYHPLFESLQEAVKDFRLAKEHDMTLVMNKRLIESQGWHLTEHDRDFLQDYDVLHQQAREDVEDLEKEVVRLEAECREKRVIPKHMLCEGGFGLESVFREEINLESDDQGPDPPANFGTRPGTGPPPGPKTVSPTSFPLLLSSPKGLLEPFPKTAEQHLRMVSSLPPDVPMKEKVLQDAKKELGIQRLVMGTQTEDKRDFVNRWLLQRLRCSALEARLLASTFNRWLKILDVERWQRDVLYFWSRDGAAVPSATAEMSSRPADPSGGVEDSVVASSVPNSGVESSWAPPRETLQEAEQSILGTGMGNESA